MHLDYDPRPIDSISNKYWCVMISLPQICVFDRWCPHGAQNKTYLTEQNLIVWSGQWNNGDNS